MGAKVVTITQPNGNGAYAEGLTDTVSVSTGTTDAGKLVLTGVDGKIDPSLVEGGDISLTAYAVSYDNPSYPTVEAALNALLYVPIQVSFSNNQGTQEIGSSVTQVTLSWTINKTIQSQTINQGIGSLTPSLRSYGFNPSPAITSNETWTITVNDGTNSVSASTTLQFDPKVYWGVSANTSLTNANILALTGQALTTSLARTVTYNATGGAYPYFIYPSSFGNLSQVVVGGLTFTDYTVTTQSVTNASGYTQNYNVVRFNNLQNGAAVQVSWS